MARTIRDSGATLLSILNDILDMSKIEAGKMQIESVPFDPAQIATRIRALHATAARDKGLAFEVAGPDPGPPRARATRIASFRSCTTSSATRSSSPKPAASMSASTPHRAR
jgi:signal transduction histidine kinase